ncbi:MAG: hypothetical protein GTO63_03145 [Anaerolineae bacterium]|nr:hypothetical protein [Anaerolineae bacterium]NIN94011.1 hypothetical protein [Anaerolineae bacterium]NIQ77049.1 hypothetical protein [Anaerolineae bacterium]
MDKDGVIRCDECKLPAAKVVGTLVVIEHRHHGKKHKTVVEITELIKLAGDQIRRTTEFLSGRCVR